MTNRTLFPDPPKPKVKPERFTLVVEVLAANTPAEIRLRKFLKLALRSYGIRCASFQPEPTPGPDLEQNAPGAR